MQGFQLTFITEEGRQQDGKPISHWLVGLARGLGVQGVTTVAGAEGIGRSGRVHAARFIELADRPIVVVMALPAQACDALLDALEQAHADVFYIKTPAEFGVAGAVRG